MEEKRAGAAGTPAAPDAVPNLDADPHRPRAERGFALAEYIADIVDSYERATTRRLVVSAFAQAGIPYKPLRVRSPLRRSAGSPTLTRPRCGRSSGWGGGN